MTGSFALFWVLAFASNTAASAASVAVLWALGDNRLPVGVLFTSQVSGVVGTLLGVSVGVRVVVRLGHRRTIAAAMGLEAIGATAVAIVALTRSGVFDTGRATVVALLLAAFPFAAGIGGPAWLALVSRWPGSKEPTRQLLLDSTQFQAGRFVGPLIAAALLATTAMAVQVAAAASAATSLALAGLVLLMRRGREDAAERTPPRQWRDATAAMLRAPALWGIAALSLSSDAARTYLPRFVRGQGLEQAVYSWTVSVLAIAAVLAAAAASRLILPDRTLSLLGLASTATALLFWASTPSTGAAGWVSGGALLGAGVSVASASLTSVLMGEAGDDRRASAAGTSMAVRTIVGASSGALMAAVAGLGAVACVPFAVLATTVTLAYARRTRAVTDSS